MKSRRLINFPEAQRKPSYRLKVALGKAPVGIKERIDDVPMSALGQKQTYSVQKLMSALPPKADMCGALVHVCFGPKADIGSIKAV
jgi:hypothetical protein